MARFCSIATLVLALAGCDTGPREVQPERVTAQQVQPIGSLGDHHVIYVPAYSHVYTVRGRFELTTTLSVHNTSFRDSVWIDKVRYYDTEGRLVYDFLKERLPLRPMQTHTVTIAQSDTTGGPGANFLVEWAGPAGAAEPLAEAVHVGVSSNMGMSFVTRGARLAPSSIPEAYGFSGERRLDAAASD